ncbi:hypothetical protein FRC17_000100 [Serendipita sp. 399]|nr:hypothetical protein FRC17_000100 [Serendipita sp. 399]
MSKQIGLGSLLQALINESKELDALETLARERCIREEQDVQYLKGIRESFLADTERTGANRLASAVESALYSETTQRAIELKGATAAISDLPYSSEWNTFQKLVNQVEELEHKCAVAEVAARTSMSFEEFWGSVRSAHSWLDLRLPREDLDYRVAVSRLNVEKDNAFSYYVNKQDGLRRHHQKRCSAIQTIFGILYKDSQIMAIHSILQDYSEVLDSVPQSPTLFDIRDDGELRGPFNKTKYFNYLRGGSESSPIFGSPIDSISGTVGRQILEPIHTPSSPPPPIFTPAIPSEMSVEKCILAGFKLEELWDKWDSNFGPLHIVSHPSRHENYATKGWLLGFILVNLPTPILPLGEDVIRRYRGRMPRQSIATVIKSHTPEYMFFHKLWRHTNDVNIKDGAEAITHAKQVGYWNRSTAPEAP